MIDCKDCVYGNQKFCCEGCDTPSKSPLGSCLHYKKRMYNFDWDILEQELEPVIRAWVFEKTGHGCSILLELCEE